MAQKKRNMAAQYLLVALVLWGTVTTSGCVSKQEEKREAVANTLNLPPAELPTYAVGTQFVYSNGSWDKVVSTDGSTVNWVNHRGYTSTGPVDIVFRRNSWQSRTRSGERVFRPIIYRFGIRTPSLWPLEQDKKFQYLEQGAWRKQNGFYREYETFWTCRVKGTEKLSVPAGTFDTWKIECGRYSNEFSAVTSRPWEYKTFYYAPAVNHWVALFREFPRQAGIKKSQRKELVAVLPGLKEQDLSDQSKSVLRSQLQHALEKNRSGQKSSWESETTGVKISTTALATFRKDGIPCRQYKQVIVQKGKTSNYFGIACRNSKGNWKIPRR